MEVLVACEFSGKARDAFIKKGHDAISCDLLPSESDFGPHIQDDILNVLYSSYWDILIAHPPCTYLCNSGVRWLHSDKTRWNKLSQAIKLFRALLYCENVDKICIENPIPHKYALSGIGTRYSQIIQPWQFGHGETKATCLWLKGLPKLIPTNIVPGRKHYIHNLPPNKDRSKLRSITYDGIASAMVNQWTI